MSIIRPSLSQDPGAESAGPSLNDVLALIPSLSVSKQARLNMASAVRTLGRILDRDLGLVPIHAPTLRRLIANASPGALGLSSTRWRNVRSGINRAIRLSGLSVNIAPERVPLTEAWEAVAVMAPDHARRSCLRRFGRFCCSLQITPGEVDDEIVQQFFDYLDLNQLSKIPDRIVKEMIRIWNRFVATEPSASIPQLATRTVNNSYTFSWEQLPQALHADAQAFKQASLHPDPFADDTPPQPVRPATAVQRDRMLRRLASAEILSGVDPSCLQSLADLMSPEPLKRGLQFFMDRNGGEPNQHVSDMLLLALGIARHWASLPEDSIRQIEVWTRKLKISRQGMTEKNRERLRQFTSDDVIRTFLNLPDKIMEDARRRPVDTRSAIKAQTAIAIAILSVAPLRLNNLRCLDRRTHFRHAFSVDDRQFQLVIPAAEVKNNQDLEFPIPARVMELIETYMRVYQPLLTNGHPSSLLFPGRSGGPKHDTALRRNITDTVYKEIGLRMNPHLFRHVCALLFLKVNPGQYESVRQLLGHKNIQTTIEFYASFEQNEAMGRYGQVIDTLREPSGPESLNNGRARP
jgi:integrase